MVDDPTLPAVAPTKKFRRRAGDTARLLTGVGLSIHGPTTPAKLEVASAAEQITSSKYREDLRQLDLLRTHGAPPEKITEYLLAPSFPGADGAATREEIASKFYENCAPDIHSADRVLRALSIVMATVAGGGIVMGAGIAATGALGTTPTFAGLYEGGLEVVNVFNDALKVFVVGAGGWLASNKGTKLFQSMKAARRDAFAPTGLAKVLADDNGPEALRGQYGFKANREALIDELAKILHPERHLLKHLSPHDLRVFLLAGDEKRKEMFRAQPPPAENQRLWRLAVRQEGNPSFFNIAAVKDELNVMLLQWSNKESTAIKSPVSMGQAIFQMRERHKETKALTGVQSTAGNARPA